MYSVKVDGVEVYTPANPQITDARLELELGAAGSFAFTMLPSCKKYNQIITMSSTVEVFEEGIAIFYGRISETETDIYTKKICYAEGALAFLNDTIQRAATFENVNIHNFFTTIINNHNTSTDENFKFNVGNIEIDDKNITYQTSYETSYEIINKCLNIAGGFLQVRRENGKSFLDWKKNDNGTNSQIIKFGVNLLDLQQKIDGDELTTCIIPLGAKGEDGERLTIKNVNDGKDYLYTGTGAKIYEVVEFDSVTDAEELKEAGQDWLNARADTNTNIEVSAADCYYLPSSDSRKASDFLRIGEKVRCYSSPHNLDVNLLVTKITIQINSALKQITLGSPTKKILSDTIANIDNTADKAVKENIKDLLDDIDNGSDDILPDKFKDTVSDIVVDDYDDIIYSYGGITADLLVNSLSTSHAITKYLAGDTSDDNHIEIFDGQVKYVSSLAASGRAQAQNPLGENLYWQSDPNADGVTRGTNGFPYLNGKRILLTTEVTTYPVYVYNYTEQEKFGVSYELEKYDADGVAIYTPTIVLGVGNQAGTNIAKIRKSADEGLNISYIPVSGSTVSIRGTVDGFLEISGFVQLVQELPADHAQRDILYVISS